MKPIDFPERNRIIGEHQTQYLPLPAHIDDRYSEETIVTCCWQLNWKERVKVLLSGVIWHQQIMFTGFAPTKLTADKPKEIEQATP